MISFRHHVVSLVAVFLALAVGVALGGGPLADTDDAAGPATSGGTATPGSGSAGTDSGDGAAAGAGSASSYAERFAATAGARLYADGLATSPVAVVTMPGADKDLLKALSTQVQAAGGRVTGRYGVRDALLDTGERSLVDTLGSQLVSQLSDPRLDASAPTYERIGQLLGVAVATTGEAVAPADQAALSARDSLVGADLVSAPSVDVANAPLVLVVLGPESDVTDLTVEIQTALLTGLAATAAGVVVLGDEDSATDGTLASLRGQSTSGVLATVDDDGSELGQVSTVLALIGVLAGRGGAFGSASADGAVPFG